MKNRYLLWQLILRDFKKKYRGSFLGVAWSVIVPLCMLVMYTYIFGSVLRVRWNQASESKYEYAVILFCGLSVFNMLSEVMSRSVSAITSNVNYVKKVMFPLEYLPLAITVTALVNCLISFGLLMFADIFVTGKVYVTFLELPIILIPLFLLCLGIAFLISSLAVYYRDVSNGIGLLIMAWMYLSPIFYSMDFAPGLFAKVLCWNPLSYLIENARRICLYGQHLVLGEMVIPYLSAMVILWVGMTVFSRIRGGFADVL